MTSRPFLAVTVAPVLALVLSLGLAPLGPAAAETPPAAPSAILPVVGPAADAAVAPDTDTAITPPAGFFAQPPGSDYFLANYTAYEAYLKRLATQSDRMRLVSIGKTSEGRTQWMAIVSSPQNLARLGEYRAIAERLARAHGIDEAEARALAAKGKAVVWIDAGMHATETVTAQGQIEVLYRMLSRNDAETRRLLDDCIILFAHDNPDGMELVANWYMRHADPEAREMATLPVLYQDYVGHDNNRDSFMSAMIETTNINRVLFRQWYPQIIYNQHQTGPEGMVVFVPPFRDPFNFNYDPIVMSQLDEVGFAMHSRLIAEDKAGSGTRSAAPYSTWHNGMERSVAYFHNSIGLLTEIIGGPTPTTIPLVPATQLPRGDEMLPIGPRAWHLRDSMDYQWTLDRAVLDYASRNRERLLFNIWKMGDNSIHKGSHDSWTVTPKKVDLLAAAPAATSGTGAASAGGRARKVDPALYEKVLHAPADRDPRAYVIPAGQTDMPTALTFIGALIKNGVEVERADVPFRAGGEDFAAGSYVVRTDQAYRPHVLDMFELQDHPHDTEYPGGPPKAPYDITGYTLAYQMGIRFVRVLDALDSHFTPVTDLPTPQPGRIEGPIGGKVSGKLGGQVAGWVIGHETNNGFILTNRLLKAGLHPAWLREGLTLDGEVLRPGAIWIPAGGRAGALVQQAVRDLGLSAHALAKAPQGSRMALRPVRIGLVDRYGGNIPSGWTRFLLEKFEFPFSMVYPAQIDTGDLGKRFDVLVFPDDALPPSGLWGQSRSGKQPTRADTPAPYRAMLGELTDAKSIAPLAHFVQGGGAIVAMGSSARLVDVLGAPLAPALVRQVGGKSEALDTRSFFIPGSILRAKVDNHEPLAYGLPGEVDMFFNRAQTFVPRNSSVGGDGAAASLGRAAWFEGDHVLRSGWAVGEERLDGTIAVADLGIGRGRLMVMGPEVAQRAQSYGTFKFLFNALLYGGVTTR